MKILMVAHRFLPRHHAGAELYAYRLARELAGHHDVVVFSASDDLMRRNYSSRTYALENLRVIEITNHRNYDDFAHSYADPKMENEFRDILRKEEPDIVYFQHLLHHSIEYPQIAAQHDVPSTLMLHEYWLLCARNGQMIQANGSRCMEPGLAKCSSCMSSFMWGRKGVDVWMLRGIAGVKRLTGVDLKGTARSIRLRRFDDDEPPGEVVDEMRKNLLIREARVRDMFDFVDCFIAPSEFLRQRFIDFGLESERILHSDYGTRIEDFAPPEPRSEGPLRIGFLGSVQPVKGVHVLMQALQDLEPGTFEALIYGDVESKPEYVKTLDRQRPESVRIMGRAGHRDIPVILRRFDVLVVPSTWWENSPLVIHEAFAAGVPVVCSALGGMAELVEDGVSGLHFEPADPSDLALKLRRLVDEPDLLPRLREGLPELKSVRQDAGFHQSLFHAVIAHHEELADDNAEAEF